MIQRKNQAARFAVVAAVAGALSFPFVSSHLRAQDEKAKPAAAAPKVDPQTVVASGGEYKLTVEDFEAVLNSLPPEQQSQIARMPEQKKRFADQLLKMKALAGEAQKRKLDQDPKTKEQMDQIEKQLQAQLKAARQQVLIQAILQTLQGDEAADKKFFDEHQDQFSQVQARHILISTQPSEDPAAKPPLTDEQAKKKAEDLIGRIKKGEDFAALVKEHSDDPGSKATGGEYTFGRGKMVPAFEQAAFALKDNEVSGPVKTNYGYHIIQTMKRVPVTFESSRGMIPSRRIEALMEQLVGKDVKFNDSFLNSVPPSPAPLPELPAAAPAPAAKPAAKETPKK